MGHGALLGSNPPQPTLVVDIPSTVPPYQSLCLFEYAVVIVFVCTYRKAPLLCFIRCHARQLRPSTVLP